MARRKASSSTRSDYPAAKLAKMILEARERNFRIAERRKTLVPLAAVRDHVAKSFVVFRQSIQRMPSRYIAEIAACLDCDPAALAVALDKKIAETLAKCRRLCSAISVPLPCLDPRL